MVWRGVGARAWDLGQVVGTVDTGSGVHGPGLVSAVPDHAPDDHPHIKQKSRSTPELVGSAPKVSGGNPQARGLTPEVVGSAPRYSGGNPPARGLTPEMEPTSALGVGQMGESSSDVEGFGARGWYLGQVVGTVDTGSGVRGPDWVSAVPVWCPGSRFGVRGPGLACAESDRDGWVGRPQMGSLRVAEA